MKPPSHITRNKGIPSNDPDITSALVKTNLQRYGEYDNALNGSSHDPGKPLGEDMLTQVICPRKFDRFRNSILEYRDAKRTIEGPVPKSVMDPEGSACCVRMSQGPDSPKNGICQHGTTKDF
jgi:hypothetical protein